MRASNGRGVGIGWNIRSINRSHSSLGSLSLTAEILVYFSSNITYPSFLWGLQCLAESWTWDLWVAAQGWCRYGITVWTCVLNLCGITDGLLTGQVSLQLCSQPTNEVTYFRAMSSIVDLPSHLKPYVPLFCNIVTRYCLGPIAQSRFRLNGRSELVYSNCALHNF